MAELKVRHVVSNPQSLIFDIIWNSRAILCHFISKILSRLCYLRLQPTKFPISRHNEQTFPIAAFFPQLANGEFFLGVGVEVAAFVFDNQDAAIFEFADEIRIEAAFGGLDPEGAGWLAVEVADPAGNFV